ncbi:hypothetical protein [Nocardioides ultimimeridianus]
MAGQWEEHVMRAVAEFVTAAKAEHIPLTTSYLRSGALGGHKRFWGVGVPVKRITPVESRNFADTEWKSIAVLANGQIGNLFHGNDARHRPVVGFERWTRPVFNRGDVPATEREIRDAFTNALAQKIAEAPR